MPETPEPQRQSYAGFLRGDAEDRAEDKEDELLEQAPVPKRPSNEPPPFLP